MVPIYNKIRFDPFLVQEKRLKLEDEEVTHSINNI